MARPATNASATQYEVIIEGIKFHVAKNGSKLVKVAGRWKKEQAVKFSQNSLLI